MGRFSRRRYWVDKEAPATAGVEAALYAVNTSRACTGTADSRVLPDVFAGTATPAGDPDARSGVTGDVIHFNATQAVAMGREYFEAYARAVALGVVVPSARTRACNRTAAAAAPIECAQ